MQNSIENFERYLRTGVEEGLIASDEEGGYRLPPETEKIILDELYHKSVMRQISSYYSTTANDITHSGGSSALWEDEKITTDGLYSAFLLSKTLIIQPKMLQSNIDHADFRILNWLADHLIDDISRKENFAFLHGDGEGKPQGILGDPNIETVQGYSYVTCDAMMSLFYNLPTKFKGNACILANRNTISRLQKLKDGEGKYPYRHGVSKDTFMDYEIWVYDDMPDIMDGSIPVAVGDFKSGYGIVDKSGITILRDPFTDKPFVKFYTTKKVGGDVLDAGAIVKLQIGEK